MAKKGTSRQLRAGSGRGEEAERKVDAAGAGGGVLGEHGSGDCLSRLKQRAEMEVVPELGETALVDVFLACE